MRLVELDPLLGRKSMTSVTKEDINKVLETLWANVQESGLTGGEHVDPHDLYADAAMVFQMTKDAGIPLEELVPNETDRKKLADYASRAEPYSSG